MQQAVGGGCTYNSSMSPSILTRAAYGTTACGTRLADGEGPDANETGEHPTPVTGQTPAGKGARTPVKVGSKELMQQNQIRMNNFAWVNTPDRVLRAVPTAADALAEAEALAEHDKI